VLIKNTKGRIFPRKEEIAFKAIEEILKTPKHLFQCLTLC
jgi:hypothetical protein